MNDDPAEDCEGLKHKLAAARAALLEASELINFAIAAIDERKPIPIHSPDEHDTVQNMLSRAVGR